MSVSHASPEPALRGHGREIVDGLGEVFLGVDADWRLIDCNPTAERFLKRRRDELVGYRIWGITGLDKDSHFADLGRRVLATRRPEEAEISLKRDRRRKLLSVRAFPLAGGVGFMLRDITLARAAQLRLAASEARYRELAHGVPAATWLSRANGKLEFINGAMAEALGRPVSDLLGDGWMDCIDPEDRASLMVARSHARSGQEPFFYEGRFRRPDDTLRIVQLYGRPRFDGDGAFCGHVGVAEDVTDVRAAELRQRTLINELNHRVKNALATVQSLVRLTLREHFVSRDIENAVVDRIMALAAAHDALTRENWRGADLARIAGDATRPYAAPGRLTLTGPAVRLPPKAAIAVAMALHELATNAVKHGALSVPEGRVHVQWVRSGDVVTLEWRESDGPPVIPPSELGFGSRLLGPVLAGEVGHAAEMNFRPTGLVCRIRAPVEEP